MSIPHPFQCIQIAQPPAVDNRDDGMILIGAAGPRIFSFSLRHGNLLTEWPSEDDDEDLSDGSAERAASTSEHANNGEPPEKRRKVSSPNDKSESSSAEFVLERPKGRRRRRPGEPALPTVAKLAVTGDSKSLVAVTAEDKCLRVFEIGARGKLRQQSQRYELSNLIIALQQYLYTNLHTK
jgi:tRNA (guanine-N(7)-)-methyltransferase subunit TRM82